MEGHRTRRCRGRGIEYEWGEGAVEGVVEGVVEGAVEGVVTKKAGPVQGRPLNR